MGDPEVHAATITILAIVGPLIGQLRAERAVPSDLIDAPEAARLLGITALAFRQRVQRGQIPRSAIHRTGRRLQFIRAKLPGVR